MKGEPNRTTVARLALLAELLKGRRPLTQDQLATTLEVSTQPERFSLKE